MIDQYATPAELRRLVSAFLVTVGAIAIFVLFAFIVVPGLRNANRPPAAPPVAAPQGETGWLDPTEYPPARGYELARIDPKTVLVASPELLEQGRGLYERRCAACHGPQGRGDGPAADALVPRPRDFSVPAGWKNGYDLVAIYRTLSEGITGSAMRSYDYLPARDRMALAHYVQSLGSFPRGPEDQGGLDALATQFASAGEKVPNRIPVSMAMAKLEAEFVSPQALALPARRDGALGARVFSRVVRDRSRAARTLAAPAWRQGVSALARAVTPGAPGNGFAVSVATLRPEEWQALFAVLMESTSR